LKDAGVIADSLTGINNGEVPLRCQEELHLGVPTGTNPEDSNPSSVEVMQWVLLYLSIGHDKCY
jgi:hypothetical protein